MTLSIYLLWLAVARVAFAALVTPANVFTGCQTSLPGSMVSVYNNGNATAFTSGTQCNTACANANGGYTHSYYQPSSGTCQCTVKYASPPANDYGYADSCASTLDYDTRLITTSFTLVGCYSTPPSGLSSIAKTGPNGCLSSCEKYTQAGFYIGSDPTYYGCLCGSGSYTSQTQCGPSTYYVYQHSLSDASQGLARRKREERYDKETKRIVPCPKGLTACAVQGSSSEAYECVDTASDLESCGGCRHGTYLSPNATIGYDCSHGAALGQSTCVQGECLIKACKPGYRSAGGLCIRRKK
ncbi:hypothetical protein BCR39DRAFT_313492 [Naematelia encephala]|uniref:Protein CPL1-like domain-containing protein n=1 Tax=Naematelia encephala TaxID=71784 RepID=A0A1Y2AQN5_9TREE|nr:hypothetical protein BCR39DRAFT_313492 [Naematelia encephala]